MRFSELHKNLPLVVGGKEKILTYRPYDNIQLAMPGRHSKDTEPIGGDFVVRVSDSTLGWKNHEFTHTDIFKDVESKREHSDIDFLMSAYVGVIANNALPELYSPGDNIVMPGIEFSVFLEAVQCLAVAEHRRYAKYESKFGGRYLPFRFSAGIAEGLWDAADAVNMQRKGRPGVEILERLHGVPYRTKVLME